MLPAPTFSIPIQLRSYPQPVDTPTLEHFLQKHRHGPGQRFKLHSVADQLLCLDAVLPPTHVVQGALGSIPDPAPHPHHLLHSHQVAVQRPVEQMRGDSTLAQLQTSQGHVAQARGGGGTAPFRLNIIMRT